MQNKNRRIAQAKRVVIPMKKQSLKSQIRVIRNDLMMLGNDVATGYELMKELVLKKMNKKLLRINIWDK